MRARGLGWGQGVALVPRQPALQQPVLQRQWLQFRCDFRLQCWPEPALQRLLADVAAGRINVIVVYKVDRLTRSLARSQHLAAPD